MSFKSKSLSLLVSASLIATFSSSVLAMEIEDEVGCCGLKNIVAKHVEDQILSKAATSVKNDVKGKLKTVITPNTWDAEKINKVLDKLADCVGDHAFYSKNTNFSTDFTTNLAQNGDSALKYQTDYL